MSKIAIDPRTLAQTAVELPSQDDDGDSGFNTAGARSEAFAEDLDDDHPAAPRHVGPVRRIAALKPWWLAAGAAFGISAITASVMAAAFAPRMG